MIFLYRLLRGRRYRRRRALRFTGAEPPTARRLRPRLSLIGVLAGALGAAGAVVLRAQYGIAPVTNVALVRAAAIGAAVSGVVLPSLIHTVAVVRFNRRRRALASRLRRPAPRPASVVVAGMVLGGAALGALGVPPRAQAAVEGPCQATLAGADAAGRSTTSTRDAVVVPEDGVVAYDLSAPEDLAWWRFWMTYGPVTWVIAEGQRDDPGRVDLGLGLDRDRSFVAINPRNVTVEGNRAYGSVEPDEFAWFGVGLYRVHGSVVTVSGMTCVASVLIDVQGDPLATVLGRAAAGVTALGALGAGLVVVGRLRDAGELLSALRDWEREMGAAGALGLPIAADVGRWPSEWGDLDGWSPMDPGLGWSRGGPGANPYTMFDAATGGAGSASCQGLPVHSVNCATLGLVVSDQLLSYGGPGPALRLALTHGAGADAASCVGPGWRFSLDARLVELGDAVVVVKGSGQVVRFRRPDVGGAARAVDGGGDRLAAHQGRWFLTEAATSTTLRFDPAPDGAWLLAGISDPAGNLVGLDRGSDGSLTEVVDAVGRRTQLLCDDHQRLTAIVAPDGRVARLHYDAGWRLARVVDLAGVETAYTYDRHGRITTIAVDEHTTHVAYDARGCVREVTDAAGNTTRYELVSARPREVRVTDPEGRATTYRSDGGRIVQAADAAGVTASFSYDGGLLVGTDGPFGRVTIDHDAEGRPVRETTSAGATTFAYDAQGRLVEVVDPLGARVTVGRDQWGHPIHLEGPDGWSASIARDERGQVTSVISASGSLFSFERDELGNVVAVTDATGARTRITYDHHGLRITAVTDPRGGRTTFELDANGRPTRMVHPDGTERHWAHSCCATGSTTDALGHTVRLARDPLLRVTEEVDAAGHRSILTHDRSGLVTSLLDPLGRESTWTYDGAGRLQSAVDGAGGVVGFAYDRLGRLIEVTDPSGRPTVVERDGAGRPTRLVDAAGRAVELDHDPLGRPVARRNARGLTVEVERRHDGQPRRWSHDGHTVASFEHDPDGMLARAESPAGALVIERDIGARVVRIRSEDGTTIAYVHDPAGNLTRIEYPDGTDVRYEYDERNRVRRVTFGRDHLEVRRDALGRIVEEARSNGVTTRVAHDPAGRVVAVAHSGAGGAFVDLVYERDPAGQVVAVSGLAPLEVEPEPGEVSTSYGPAGQVASHGGAPVDSDADGNVTAMGADWLAEYDAEDRLVALHRSGGTRRYGYDALGRLATLEGGGRHGRLVRDPAGRVVAETDGAGTITRHHVWLGAALVASTGPGGDTVFDHHDATGNVLARTDRHGEVVAAHAYDPFGAHASSWGRTDLGATFGGRHGVLDEGDGVFLMGERAYHAPTGRFLQRDPAGLWAGANLYAYAGGDPVSWIDPTGTTSEPAWLSELREELWRRTGEWARSGKAWADENIPAAIDRTARTFDHYLGPYVRRRVGELSHPIRAPLRHLEHHNRGGRVEVTPGQMRRELGGELRGHVEDLAEVLQRVPGPVGAAPGLSGARRTLDAARAAAEADYERALDALDAQAEPFLEDFGGPTGHAMHRIRSQLDGVKTAAERAREGLRIYQMCPSGGGGQ